METKTTGIELTFDEADALFGVSDKNPVTALHDFYIRHIDIFDRKAIRDFRVVSGIIRLLVRIKSRDTIYLLRNLNNMLLKDQFRGKSKVTVSSFRYLLLLAWHFRHCRNVSDLEKAGHDREFIIRFKEQLIECGISVQPELSFS